MGGDIIEADWPVTDISANLNTLETEKVSLGKGPSVSWLHRVAPPLLSYRRLHHVLLLFTIG